MSQRAVTSKAPAEHRDRRRKNRTSPINFSPDLYRSRNLVERFFNKIK